jgi:DNA-nicking Smr family endonuclease
MSPGRKPPISPEDSALWDEIAKSVRPLAGRRKTAMGPAEERETPGPSSKAPERPLRTLAPAVQPPKGPPPLAPLDRRMRQKLSRGSAGIDGRVDLHGHTQAEARHRLLRFLQAAQDRGDKLVLVITGKGSRGDTPDGERGVLKRQVPLWLALPEFRALVVGFEESAPQHGGGGALYVRIRRARD